MVFSGNKQELWWLICWVAVASLAALPQSVWACAVCAPGTESSRQAYIATTVMMSFIPLGLVGGIFFFIRKSLIRSSHDEAENDISEG